MADAVSMLTGINSHICVVLFGVGIAVATIRFPYQKIAAILKWLALVLFAYVITAFIVGADWRSVLRDTFVPSLPANHAAWQSLVAILGTTISPYLFFWQASQEVEEEKSMGRRMLADRLGATRRELGLRELDVGVGTFFSNIVMYFIILTTALTLCIGTALPTSRLLARRRKRFGRWPVRSRQPFIRSESSVSACWPFPRLQDRPPMPSPKHSHGRKDSMNHFEARFPSMRS